MINLRNTAPAYLNLAQSAQLQQHPMKAQTTNLEISIIMEVMTISIMIMVSTITMITIPKIMELLPLMIIIHSIIMIITILFRMILKSKEEP